MTLRNGDLERLIDNIIEIDSFQSKMGSEEDVITLSISVKNKPAAQDLMDFIEKGYEFVLDAETTTGEQSDGNYRVFVEIDRSRRAVSEILEIIGGLKRLSNINDLKFRYYKSFRSVPLNKKQLEKSIPVTSDQYIELKDKMKLNNYSNFFDRSFVESIYMDHNDLIIQKKWSDPLRFKFIDFGSKKTIDKSLTETFNHNDYPEILFLTKYIGDYNISKYGKYITMENDGKTLMVQRYVV